MNAVAPGLGTHIDNRITGARRRRIKNIIGSRETHRHGVNQNIAVVASVEITFATNRGHTNTVAVTANAGHDARHQVFCNGIVRLAKAERVHVGDRPCPHGENVPQNTADPGGGTLVGLDIGRMVMAFHFENSCLAIADIDNARIFTRPADHPGCFGGQGLEPFL